MDVHEFPWAFWGPESKGFEQTASVMGHLSEAMTTQAEDLALAVATRMLNGPSESNERGFSSFGHTVCKTPLRRKIRKLLNVHSIVF